MKNQTLALTLKVIRHMDHMADGHQKGGVLLTGDPGIGKTSFVKIFGSLVGIKTIIIEVPHITEEHIINIPFIVFHPQTNSTQSMQSQMTPDYKLVLAQSNLYTQITSSEQMSDDMYLQHIKQSPGYVQQLFVSLGGNDKQIPDVIKEVRQRFKSILFLDEFYRQTSTRIRNILRGILNNKIGMHNIPQSTYIMYASNMRDTGLEDIPSNQQFQAIEYKNPSKKDWFDWLVATYKEHADVKLNPAILQKFKKALDDQDLSHTDVENEVRTSPRRWEQILLYLNSSLPVSNHEEAQTLLTNIKNNFVHYQTGKHSDLNKKVLEAVAELIKETSNIEIASSDTLSHTKWRSSLTHLVEQQMKLGGVRKHIPVVAGAPGIGKTAQALAVAKKFNMRLIDIDVSELNADDVIGMPIPGGGKDEDMSVRFSVPKLYQQINKQIERQNEEYINGLREKHGNNAGTYVQQYKNQKWKYLIFFDEINRADEKTFNALRKVILEKNFGPSGDNSGKDLELPEGSIVIAAMNPEGTGTSELTHHFRDVIDVVPAEASWNDTKKYLGSQTFKGVSDEVKQVALNIVDAFAHKFASKDDKYEPDQAPFHINTGTEIYISPREYTDMFATLVRELNSGIKEILQDTNIKENQIRGLVDDMVGEALEDSLNFIFYKHQVDKEEFLQTLKNWVGTLDASLFGGLVSKKFRHAETLSGTLSNYLDGKDLKEMPENVNIVNLNNSVNNAQFIEEFKSLLSTKFTDDAAIKKYVLSETHPGVTMKDGDDTISIDGSTKTSLLANLVLALLYTLHIHQYDNDRIAVVGKSLSTAASEVLNKLHKASKIDDDTRQEAAVNIANLRTQIQDLVSSL